jgi:eukaryotic-like serine/threonine-protein kinase
VSTRAGGLSDAAVTRLRALGRWPAFESGRYSVSEEIGRGGMGTVFLAVDEELGREVAIKIPNGLASADLERRLQSEARVLARLEHPGIVPIHDAGRLADGRLFYVMKRVKGRTLREQLRGVSDLTERLRLFERICEPVAFAHAEGFIHRDLKPENIMVGSFGEVMVMDWGVAKTVVSRQSTVVSHSRQSESAVPVDGRQSESAVPVDGRQSESAVPVDGRQSGVVSHSRQSESPVPVDGRRSPVPVETGAGTVIGTVGFMAPEQARGEVGEIDERADVYGLGAILFLLLTDGIADADPSAKLRLARVPRPLAAICTRALAAETANRYQSVTALADDVARYRANRKVDAYRETTLDQIVRFGRTHRTAILLVLAYIVMRIAVAFLAGR